MAESNRAGDTFGGNGWWSGLSLEELTHERQLLLNRAHGSREAHEALLTSFLPMMRSFFVHGLSRKIAREEPAGDLVQSAVALAWRAFDQFDGCHIAQYQQWLMTLCGNLLASLLRRLGPDGPQDLSRKQPLDEQAVDDARHPYGRRPPSPVEILKSLEAGAQLEAALRDLPGDEQQVVRLHHFDGLTFARSAAGSAARGTRSSDRSSAP
ncbi:MAG TPA: sigma-70 family RNA polymerase sigma factor [Pirellulales bacterium]|nr:sigma-70 family RNA polymerase sigma factor [Pirellulales bacterium]